MPATSCGPRTRSSVATWRLGADPQERRETVEVVPEELDRMTRYVEDLLPLAKAPRPDFLRLGPIDLDLFTHDLFSKATSLGGARLASRWHRRRDRCSPISSGSPRR